MARSRLEATTLRDQLTLLNNRQQQLMQEVKAGLSPADKGEGKLRLKNHLSHRVESANQLAQHTSEMFDNYVVWTPRDLDVEKGSLGTFKAKGVKLVASMTELAAQSKAKKPAEFLPTAELAYQQIRDFHDTLPNLLDDNHHPQMATHIAHRMEESEKLITDISGWMRKEQMLNQGQHNLIVEVDQHRITVDTVELARKLTSIKAQCEGISRELAEKADKFLLTMEVDLVPELELCQVSFSDDKCRKAIEHQAKSIEYYARAEKELDELMVGIIKHLDSLPYDKNPQFPDGAEPESLDQLLAMLENEAKAAESLGIPCCRPSNLMIEKDWATAGSMPGGGSGAGRGPGRRTMQVQAQLDQAKQANDMAEKIRKQTDEALKKLMKQALNAGGMGGLAKRRRNGLGTRWARSSKTPCAKGEAISSRTVS
ncbi:MAG: hypothetical protein U0903_04005 [Planctomycetales bacterium]